MAIGKQLRYPACASKYHLCFATNLNECGDRRGYEIAIRCTRNDVIMVMASEIRIQERKTSFQCELIPILVDIIEKAAHHDYSADYLTFLYARRDPSIQRQGSGCTGAVPCRAAAPQAPPPP